MGKSVKVTRETETGLNTNFVDTKTGRTMNRGEFVEKIEHGKYPDYHVMHVNKGNKTIKVPRSDPDDTERNNLG